MRVEPNKKLVSQHISAYKNIIADLRDEIDKLKNQLQTDLAQKTNPLTTKHAAMYKPPGSNMKAPIVPPKLDNIEESQSRVDNLESVRSSTTSQVIAQGGLISGRSALIPGDLECECELRYLD